MVKTKATNLQDKTTLLRVILTLTYYSNIISVIYSEVLPRILSAPNLKLILSGSFFWHSI